MNHSQRFISSLASPGILMLAPPASVSSPDLSQASPAVFVAWAVCYGHTDRPGGGDLNTGLGWCWCLHRRQDTHHLRSLCRWDVLGHVHNRIHGHLRISLNKAEKLRAEWKFKIIRSQTIGVRIQSVLGQVTCVSAWGCDLGGCTWCSHRWRILPPLLQRAASPAMPPPPRCFPTDRPK